jgi:DNA-binding transcriptional LysR family regulator
MDIEVRHLEALVAVAEAGTFGRAAASLGFTQSAVSQQIAGLERAVGAPVFDRPGGPRPVRLTAAGEVLLEHAQSVLAALRAAQADVAALTSGDRGRLRVGTIQSVGTRVIPSLLMRFAAERPGVEIVLHEAHNPEDLLAMVEDQQLDVTFCSGLDVVELEARPFTARLVLEDPFVLLAPASAEWRDRSSASLEEIATHPLIGNRNPTCAGQTMLTFGALHPEFVFHSDDNSTVQRCVAAGLGVALSPLLTIDVDDPTTAVIPVRPEVPPRLITLAWHESRRPSALLDAFVEAAVEVGQAIAAEWATEVAHVA